MGGTYKHMVEALEQDKDRLLSQVSQLQTEIVDVRQQLVDCQQARTAVERELIDATQNRDEFRQYRERAELEHQLRGGVRGLLRGAVNRFRRVEP